MFEFSIASKYLVPKRKQLSVSLIAFMSVGVISLVVWLVLVFLSVTDGIEQSWTQKLTALNAPLRITPTKEYFSSYYYQVDSISAASNYAQFSIGEKAAAPLSNPYDPQVDVEPPPHWPLPHLDEHHQLIDPVKRAFAILEKRGLSFQDYEIAGALMRLQMVKKHSLFSSNRGGDAQNFLTQVSYVASLAEKSPSLSSLLLDPSLEDINHLFSLSSYDLSDNLQDSPEHLQIASKEKLVHRLQELFARFHVDKLRPEERYWRIPLTLLPDSFSCRAIAGLRQEQISHFIIPDVLSDFDGFIGLLKKNQHGWEFISDAGARYVISDEIPLIAEGEIELQAHLLTDSFSKMDQLADVRFEVEGTLQGIPLKGETSWGGFAIAAVNIHEPVRELPLVATDLANGVFLPKSFQEGGVKIGDTGYLSYAAATASSLQEQRLPILVSGFYDPGIISIGNKCILAKPELVRILNSANHSFQIDRAFANGIQVWVDDIKQAKALKTELCHAFEKADIGRYWTISTYHDYDFAKDLLQQFQSDRYLFTMIGAIILIVACCNIISLLVLLVNDKKKEIGILQAMGASTGSIAGIFAICGAGMGILSSLIGTGAAVLTLHHIDIVVQFLSMIQGHEAFNALFYGKSLPSVMSTDALFFVLIATPLLSLCAAIVPALKACRLSPSAILRSE